MVATLKNLNYETYIEFKHLFVYHIISYVTYVNV